MGSVGFGKMVEALAAPIAASATTNGSGNAGTPSSAAADRPTQPGDGTTGAGGRPAGRWTRAITGPGGRAPGQGGVSATTRPARAAAARRRRGYAGQDQPTRTDGGDATPPPPALGTRHLTIDGHERLFMKRLHELIPSPRAAKRFVNVYRLVKAKAEANEERFERLTFPFGGDYRAALLLLAILTGFPEQAAEILGDLIKSSGGGAWWEFLEEFRDRSRPRPTCPDGEKAGAARQAAARWTALFEDPRSLPTTDRAGRRAAAAGGRAMRRLRALGARRRALLLPVRTGPPCGLIRRSHHPWYCHEEHVRDVPHGTDTPDAAPYAER